MPSSTRLRTIATIATALVVFSFSWLFRFNDPGGSFAGLTDDHFFYLVRGWQILFGDLPVRDFADHGAPLFYYVGAAVQMGLGRGTISELTFCVTVLSVGAALTFWLAERASGALWSALIGAAVAVLLQPRFYNYPKILVYTAAIPLLWRFADRPTAWSRFWLALTTAIGFLFRHDHGVFIALAFAALLAMLQEIPWRLRLQHAAIYALLVLALLSPYLLFIQSNGGLMRYFDDASAWAARDRERAPVAWPGLFDEPIEGAPAGIASRSIATVRANFVAWMYYLELALPFFALAALAVARGAFRPDWGRAAPKIATVAVLAIVLNAGFLRSPLGARLADPSVPHAILIAWLLAGITRVAANRSLLRENLRSAATPVRIALIVTALPFAIVLGAGLSNDLQDRLDKAALAEGSDEAFERVEHVRRSLRKDWDLESWIARDDRHDLITLALYLNTCTKPSERVFVQPYIPQVLALARRGFAGGHADLRPGFFDSLEAQQLTLARLQRQSVPVMLLETGGSYEEFRKSFPVITPYIDSHYKAAGSRVFDRRFGIQLFVRGDRTPSGRFEALDWPCFR